MQAFGFFPTKKLIEAALGESTTRHQRHDTAALAKMFRGFSQVLICRLAAGTERRIHNDSVIFISAGKVFKTPIHDPRGTIGQRRTL